MRIMEETHPRNREKVYAALDLGTNNCRLLLTHPQLKETKSGRSLRSVDGFSRIVRLGEGVSSSGRLSEEAMERTIEALRSCRGKMERYSVIRGRYVATEACRKASNALEFMQRIKQETGLTIEIISNEEEARLALLGCCSLLKKRTRKALAFDIGGGSTEIMWVEATPLIESEGAIIPVIPFDLNIRDWISVPYGVMNLSERFGSSAYADLYFRDMVERVREAVSPLEARHSISQLVGEKEVQLLSTSGTVTTLAAIHLDLQRYERSRIDGIRLTHEAISASIERLLSMRPSERFNHPCIGADRSDFILAGCAIVTAIFEVWPFASITIADRGVREGIIVSMLMDQKS